MTSVSPPQNNTKWPLLSLALQIVYDTNTGIAPKKPSMESHFSTLKKFKNCLETLEACSEETFPQGYVLEDNYSITGSYGISYVGIQNRILHFSVEKSMDYETLFKTLRVTTNRILRGIEPPEEDGKIFEDFAKYLEQFRD